MCRLLMRSGFGLSARDSSSYFSPSMSSTHADDVKDVKDGAHVSEKSATSPVNDADLDLALTPDEERKLKRRIYLRIVPYCSLLYLMSFLDR